MEVEHDSPFVADMDEVIDKDGSLARVAVLKATFEVDAHGSLNVAEEQEPICHVDQLAGEPGASSTLYESDGAYFKPATDIVVCGKVFAPGGRPTASLIAEISVGPVTKQVLVTGDRRWSYSSILGVNKSNPEPFTEMPICWERSFGGEDSFHQDPTKHGLERRNPVGTGFRVTKSAEALDGLALPNFEDPQQPISGWRDKPDPQGFGFIGRGWLPRVEYAGTYDEAWQKNRMPILPVDFDYRFFNGAPSGQICPGHLQGGEAVRAVNLTPDGELLFCLPKFSVTFRGVSRKEPLELQGLLDTVVFKLERAQDLAGLASEVHGSRGRTPRHLGGRGRNTWLEGEVEMLVTVAVNPPDTVVHKSSMGMAKTQLDVCKTPTPGGPVPTPYPNIAMSLHTSKGSKSVKCDGNPIMLKTSCFMMSTGDEPGSLGGVKSNMIKGQADPMNYSFDVKVEGKNVFRRSDPMMQNKKNCI